MQQVHIVFMLVLFIIGVLQKTSANPNIDYEQSYQGICERTYCNVSCKYGSLVRLSSDIDLAMREFGCKQIALNIYAYTFPHQRILESWEAWKRPITELSIYDSNVTEIQTNAFVNQCFAETTKVYLNNLGLTKLAYGVFNGLHNVKALTIVQKMPIEILSNMILNPFRYKLRSLSIQSGQSSLDLFKESEEGFDVTTLDLSYNRFGDIENADTFNHFGSLKLLNLSYCEITSLPTGLFAVVGKTLKYLDLSHNLLTRISADLLQPVALKSSVQIDISRNPYDCNCQMAPLVNMIGQQTKKFVKLFKMKCNTPKSFEGEYMVLKLFLACENKNGLVNNPVGGPFPLYVKTTDNTLVMCQYKDCKKSKCFINTKLPLGLRRTDTEIKISKEENGVFVLEIDPPVEDYDVLWFKKATRKYYQMDINHRDFGLGCSVRIDGPVYIENVEPDTSYLVCLVRKKDLTISPFGCASFRHGSSYTNITYWLSQSSKTAVIASSVVGAVSSVSLGAYILFYIMKQRPTILKKSKRIMIAKKDSKDVLVLPRNSRLHERHYETIGARRYQPKPRKTDNLKYAYPNLYEVIPAHRNTKKFDEVSIYYSSSHVYSGERRPTKRFSNDPLPMLPSTKKDENFYSDSGISESSA